MISLGDIVAFVCLRREVRPVKERICCDRKAGIDCRYSAGVPVALFGIEQVASIPMDLSISPASALLFFTSRGASRLGRVVNTISGSAPSTQHLLFIAKAFYLLAPARIRATKRSDWGCWLLD